MQYEPSIFSQHTIAPWEQTPQGWGVSYHINSLGYRGREFEPSKPEGIKRIFFLGGSSVFDLQAGQDKDWPSQVGNKLREAGFTNIECINAGTPGHTTFDAVGRLYSEIHTFQPDYLVLYCTWNDLKYFTSKSTLLRSYSPTKTDYRFHYYNEIDRLLCEVSQLYVKVRNRLILMDVDIGLEGAVVSTEPKSRYENSKIEQYRLNIELFIDCARNIGAVPILATEVRLLTRKMTASDKSKIGYNWMDLTHEALLDAYEACDRVIFDIAERKEVRLFDAASLFSGRSDLLLDHIHLSPQGSDTLSTYIAENLTNVLEDTVE